MHIFRFIFILLIASAILTPKICFSQNHSFKRLSHIEGQLSGGQDWGFSVAYDKEKSIYTVGSFAGSSDFDPGIGEYIMTTSNYSNIFIQKIDSAGNFQWAIQYGLSTSNEYARDIRVTADSSILITGECGSNIDFDPGISVVNGSQPQGRVFLLKLDKNGNFKWVKNFGGTSFETGFKIATDANENIYLAGNSGGPTIDFDPGPNTQNITTNGLTDIWIAKFDPDGNLIWSNVYGGTENDIVYGLNVSDNFIYISGNFSQTVDFDPNGGGDIHSSNGGADAFIQQLNLTGNVQWTKTFGGPNYDSANDLSINSTNEIVIVGSFNGTIDFNSGIGDSIVQSTYNDPFILKLNEAGDFQWVNTIKSSSSSEFVNAVCTDTLDNFYITGKYTGECDFDTPLGYNSVEPTNAYPNVFYAKIDPGGNYLWSKSISDQYSNTNEGKDIEIDDDLNLYITGTFGSTADFDPGPNTYYNSSPANAGDVFTLTLESCFCEDSIIVVNECNDYLWINNETYISDTITYIVVPNSTGCDSVVILNLFVSITNSTVSVIDETTLQSNMENCTYQWYYCNSSNSFSQIIGETNQSYSAQTNGNYSVVVSTAYCNDTSSCFSINTINLSEIYQSKYPSISPNPFTKSISITGLKTSASYQLLDLNGRTVDQGIILNDTISNLENLNNGVYILKLVEEKAITTYRIMK